MHGGVLKTDSEIASKKGVRNHRELVKWDSGTGGNFDSSLNTSLNDISNLELEGSPNEKGLEKDPYFLSTYVSGYDENLYTTELDISKIPKDVQDKAIKLSLEIQESQTDSGSEDL